MNNTFKFNGSQLRNIGLFLYIFTNSDLYIIYKFIIINVLYFYISNYLYNLYIYIYICKYLYITYLYSNSKQYELLSINKN